LVWCSGSADLRPRFFRHPNGAPVGSFVTALGEFF
jgi:hypothetical protein